MSSMTGSLPQLGYAGEPGGTAYEAWREEFCRRVMCGDVVPLESGPVRCDITALPLPRVKLSGAAGTPMQFVATGADQDQALAFVLASQAPVRIVVGQRDLDLAPMGIGLADAAHVGADVSQLAEGRFQSLFIERKTLLAFCPQAEDLIARPLGANEGVKALLRQYYDLVLQHAHSLDAVAQNAVAQHLIDLVVLSLGTGRDEAERAKDRGLAAARFEALKADILAQLGDGCSSATAPPFPNSCWSSGCCARRGSYETRCNALARSATSHISPASTMFHIFTVLSAAASA
jgi:hypothetical protein